MSEYFLVHPIALKSTEVVVFNLLIFLNLHFILSFSYLFIPHPQLETELKELTKHSRIVPQADTCSGSEEVADYKVGVRFLCILLQI